jgi:hypothetical protein
MYPSEIRFMAHSLIFFAIVCCSCPFESIEPKLEFATRKEYDFWLSEQAEFQAMILGQSGDGKKNPWLFDETNADMGIIPRDLMESLRRKSMGEPAPTISLMASSSPLISYTLQKTIVNCLMCKDLRLEVKRGSLVPWLLQPGSAESLWFEVSGETVDAFCALLPGNEYALYSYLL